MEREHHRQLVRDRLEGRERAAEQRAEALAGGRAKQR
jgi:hypothetical protein